MLQYSDKHDRSPVWIFDDCMYLKVHETLPPGNLLNPIPDLVKRKIDAEEPWTPPIWWSHVDWSWKVPKHPMVYYNVPILKSYLGYTLILRHTLFRPFTSENNHGQSIVDGQALSAAWRDWQLVPWSEAPKGLEYGLLPVILRFWPFTNYKSGLLPHLWSVITWFRTIRTIYNWKRALTVGLLRCDYFTMATEPTGNSFLFFSRGLVGQIQVICVHEANYCMIIQARYHDISTKKHVADIDHRS